MLTILDTGKKKHKYSKEYKNIIQKTNTKSVYEIAELFSNRIIRNKTAELLLQGSRVNPQGRTDASR